MNKAILMGRLTRDPDIRWTQGQDQTCFARFTIAVDRNRAKKEGQQSADFIPCKCFGKRAEWCEKWLHKGTKIALSGRIETGSYTNRDGVKVYTTEVFAEDIEFAESKAAAGSGDQETQERQQAEQITVDEDGFMEIPDGIDEELPFS